VEWNIPVEVRSRTFIILPALPLQELFIREVPFTLSIHFSEDCFVRFYRSSLEHVSSESYRERLVHGIQYLGQFALVAAINVALLAEPLPLLRIGRNRSRHLSGYVSSVAQPVQERLVSKLDREKIESPSSQLQQKILQFPLLALQQLSAPFVPQHSAATW
jgi:hypothetical protein